MKPVEDFYDAVFQGGPPDNRIIDNYQSVVVFPYHPVSDIVYMGHQVVPAVFVCNESAKLDILDRDLFDSWFNRNDFHDLLIGKRSVFAPDFHDFPTGKVFPDPFNHSVKGGFRGVGDIGKNGILKIIICPGKNYRSKQPAKRFPLIVNILVASP